MIPPVPFELFDWSRTVFNFSVAFYLPLIAATSIAAAIKWK